MNAIEQPFEFGRIDPEQLQGIAQQMGVQFPEAYVRFLLETNGGYPRNSVVRLPGQALAEVQYFLAAGTKNRHANLERTAERMKGRIPGELLPVAINSGGDYYCLALSGPHTGKMFLWRHDNEAENDGSHFYGNVRLLANSFEEFFNHLQPDE